MKAKLLNLLRAAAHRLPEALLGVFLLALAPMAVLGALALWRQVLRLMDSPGVYWDGVYRDPGPTLATLACILGMALLAFVLWRTWTPVWAVARKMIIEAMHRKVVLILLIFFVVLVCSMPFLLKTEGTVKSQVQLVLMYSLVLAMVLLSLLAIFLSVASVCSEIEHKQVHITDTKPLRRWEFLLGKWFGVVVLCTAALFAMSAVVCGFVLYLARPPDLSHMDQREAARAQKDYGDLMDEVLVERKSVQPLPPPGIAEAVEKEIAEQQASGKLSRNPHMVNEIRTRRTRELRDQAASVPAGSYSVWCFEGLAPGRPGNIYVRFNGWVASSKRIVDGQWVALRRQLVKGEDGKTQTQLAMLGTVSPPPYGWPSGAVNQFTIPASVVPPDGTLFLAFENTHTGAAVTFEAASIEIMQQQGGFLPNYYRTVLVLATHIALLAALGLMAGSVFSFPVASLTVAFFFIIGLVGPWFASFLEPDPFAQYTGLQGAVRIAWSSFIGGVLTVLPHFGNYSPLGALTDGKAVTWAFLAASGAVMVFLKGGVALLLGMYFYTRRELARVIV